MGSINATEKRFKQDIEFALLSPADGYTKDSDTYDSNLNLYVDTPTSFA